MTTQEIRLQRAGIFAGTAWYTWLIVAVALVCAPLAVILAIIAVPWFLVRHLQRRDAKQKAAMRPDWHDVLDPSFTWPDFPPGTVVASAIVPPYWVTQP